MINEEREIISYISRNYSNSLKKKLIYNGFDKESNKNEDAIFDYAEEVLKLLDKEYSNIIMNEFLLKNTPKRVDKQWYLEYYSQSTFRRLKKAAIKEFIRCIKL